MSTSVEVAGSTNSRWRARDRDAGTSKEETVAPPGPSAGAHVVGPQQQQHALRTRELDLGAHLGAVEGTRRHDGVALERHAMDVAGEAETELHGHGRAVAHAVDGEAEQRHARLPRGDERLHGGLIDVVLELVRCDLDGHDLLHALDVDGVDERGGITSDHRNRDRPEPAPGRDQLSGHVPDLTPDVLGNDENAHASRSLTIAAIRPAISAGLPSIISAPCPRSGTNILRTT